MTKVGGLILLWVVVFAGIAEFAKWQGVDFATAGKGFMYSILGDDFSHCFFVITPVPDRHALNARPHF